MLQTHNEQFERATQALTMKIASTEVYYSVWYECAQERQKQVMEEASERMLQTHNVQFKRAMQVLAMQNASVEVHYCFFVWCEGAQESRQRRVLDEARERVLQKHSEQFERAMQFLAMQHASAEVPYCFSVWCECARERRYKRIMDEASERMLKKHN